MRERASNNGAAGQRCLAASAAVTVGHAQTTFTEAIAEAAASRKVGYGLDEGVQMGPVISPASKDRIEQLIGLGEKEGARVLVVGVIMGLLAAAASTRALRSLLFEVRTLDPLAFAGVAGAMVMVGLLAAWVPARRASR